MGFLGKIAGGITGAITGRGGGAGSRQQFDVVKGAEGNLGDVFNYGFNTGQQDYATGKNNTNQAFQDIKTGYNNLSSPLSYWQKIASGNRPAVMQTLAPETNAAIAQNDAARRQAVATGTARGGGLAAPMQQKQDDLRASIDNMLFGQRSQAPGEISKIGSQQANVGSNEAALREQQIQQALSLLGLGTQAGAEQGSLAKNAMDSQAAFTQNTIKQLNQAFTGAGQMDWTDILKPMPLSGPTGA